MRWGLAALLTLAAAPAAGQSLVVSPRPEAVSVTVYRDPGRPLDEAMDLQWLNGFALITETRTLRLPAGQSVVRFEGVAGGIEPASAIVVGLPGGVGEKNRDARLISPGALVERALGRPVHIRRTNPKTGAVTEEEGVIRSGPAGIILQTRGGFEALRCSGLPETLVLPGVPEDLSALPTLAVTTVSPRAETVTVRLSYLARQFDWEANYLATVAADGKTLDLFAWLTLANANDESFPEARTQAVAGEINREDEDGPGPETSIRAIEARCWPRGSTSDLPLVLPPAPAVPIISQDEFSSAGADIVVTGSRIRQPNLMSMSPVTAISAEQEELGDLKLYRIPEPVTVSAHGQKQVALLSRSKVPFERVHTVVLTAGENVNEPVNASILLRTKNVKARNLGLPLPMGTVALFEQAEGRPMLVAEREMPDSAIGQELELDAGESPDVVAVQWRAGHRCEDPQGDEDEDEDDCDSERGRSRVRRMVVEVSNARAEPVAVEVVIGLFHPWNIERPSRDFVSRDGHRMWLARVPANGRKRITFTLRREPQPRRRDEED
jgi:hypothetical protein